MTSHEVSGEARAQLSATIAGTLKEAEYNSGVGSDDDAKGLLAWVRRHSVGLYVLLGVLWLLLALYDLVVAVTGSGTSREWFSVYISAFLGVLSFATALLAFRARRKAAKESDPNPPLGHSED